MKGSAAEAVRDAGFPGTHHQPRLPEAVEQGHLLFVTGAALCEVRQGEGPVFSEEVNIAPRCGWQDRRRCLPQLCLAQRLNKVHCVATGCWSPWQGGGGWGVGVRAGQRAQSAALMPLPWGMGGQTGSGHCG